MKSWGICVPFNYSKKFKYSRKWKAFLKENPSSPNQIFLKDEKIFNMIMLNEK